MRCSIVVSLFQFSLSDQIATELPIAVPHPLTAMDCSFVRPRVKEMTDAIYLIFLTCRRLVSRICVTRLH